MSQVIQLGFSQVNKFRRFLYIGNTKICPICKKTFSNFAPFGKPQRKEALCLYCGSLERHRLIWLYFERMTDLFNNQNKSMLHFAPERCFTERLKKQIGAGYVTADLYDNSAMVKMDITKIQFPNGTFDVVYCSHVLEHVTNDIMAISELYRVLKDDGWAVISVPIYKHLKRTREDNTITNPKERERIFGQKDHVRAYGPDYSDRLRSVGFKVRITSPHDFLSDAEIKRMGIPALKEIHFCTK